MKKKTIKITGYLIAEGNSLHFVSKTRWQQGVDDDTYITDDASTCKEGARIYKGFYKKASLVKKLPVTMTIEERV